MDSRIAIVDDHALFRKSLKLLINSFENMAVVTEASNGRELLEKLETESVDILLLDMEMPEMGGFETCQNVNTKYPEIKVLVLTHLDEAQTIRNVLQLDIQGYFTKNTDPLELKNAILKLQHGGFYFERKLKSLIESILENPKVSTQENLITFSKRELEILNLTIEECSGSKIADELCISPRTVEKHKRNLMKKTASKNFIGVIIYALQHDFISIDE